MRDRRRARSEAHRSEAHRLRYIDASRRASSVISRAKFATWQAICSNLSPRSDPRAVFRLLNAISGKKNTSQDPSFPGCSSPLDTANHYAYYLRSHLSQATPRTSRRAERQFMNELRKASCEDALSFPVFAAMATVFFYPNIFTGSVGRRILLVVPVDTLYRTSIISSSTVLPLNPFVNLSLAPLSLFLTYGSDLGVWPGCWVSAEFLRAPIPRKGSGSTTTTHFFDYLVF